MLEFNNKFLKNISPIIWIYLVNQSLRKERERDANKAVNEICGPEWQTGKYDMYIHIYRIMKNPDLVCIRLYVAPKYKMFFPVSNNIQEETERGAGMFQLVRKVGKIWTTCREKGNFTFIYVYKYGHTWKM